MFYHMLLTMVLLGQQGDLSRDDFTMIADTSLVNREALRVEGIKFAKDLQEALDKKSIPKPNTPRPTVREWILASHVGQQFYVLAWTDVNTGNKFFYLNEQTPEVQALFMPKIQNTSRTNSSCPGGVCPTPNSNYNYSYSYRVR